jgi:hypothetical protein
MVQLAWRALVEKLDRGEPIELLRPTKLRPTDPRWAMVQLAERVGGKVVWIDPCGAPLDCGGTCCLVPGHDPPCLCVGDSEVVV